MSPEDTSPDDTAPADANPEAAPPEDVDTPADAAPAEKAAEKVAEEVTEKVAEKVAEEAPAAASPEGPTDAELEAILVQRKRQEAQDADAAARDLQGPGACPVCDTPTLEAAGPWNLFGLFLTRPGLACSHCDFKAPPRPNPVGFAIVWLLGAGLVLLGMSEIFSAQRLDHGSRTSAFILGAGLFGAGLFVVYGVQGIRSLQPLSQRILRLRRRRRDQEVPKPTGDAFREHLETFVVALILALVIRHFVMEAFVIPTGSMAPTLLGDHFQVECPNCGYEFAISKDEREFSTRRTERRVNARCPLDDTTFHVERTPADVYGGNKILVNKFIYSYREPRRWEVIVFKFPDKPWKNFIKRLVGLPGETLRVEDGDLLVDGQLARKPDHVQDAMWIPVHDSRYTRKEAHGWYYWEPVSPDGELDDAQADAWDQSDEAVLVCDPPQGRAPWLRYRRAIRDGYGYQRGHQGGREDVHDLRLRARVTAATEGPVRLSVLEGQRAVTARFQFGAGASVIALEVDGHVELEVEHPSLTPGQPVDLELSYADELARVKVMGETVLRWEDPYAPSTLDSGRGSVQLHSEAGRTTFEQVQIDRDVYYVPPSYSIGTYDVTQGDVTLPNDCFFVMGDNSPNSEDSRKWGFVDRDHLVGKAFLVFWPIVPFEVELIR